MAATALRPVNASNLGLCFKIYIRRGKKATFGLPSYKIRLGLVFVFCFVFELALLTVIRVQIVSFA